MEKYLTDSDIIKWNERLQKSSYLLTPTYVSNSSNPNIMISRKNLQYFGDNSLCTTSDLSECPKITYDFIFSISKNREKEFNDLLDRLFMDKFSTKLILNGVENNIIINNSIVDYKDVKVHYIKNIEYIRCNYHFVGDLCGIIAYISYIEDAINFFSKVWGYDDKGVEMCLMKFPIGSIVSPSDKSIDYLVLDYNYKKRDGKYNINYVVSEMTRKGMIITYGDVLILNESSIGYSRNGRIDDLLN